MNATNKQKKITTVWLAKQLGITHGAISQWKKNNRIPGDQVFKVAKIINVDAESLNNDNSILFDMFGKSYLQSNNNTSSTADKSTKSTTKVS